MQNIFKNILVAFFIVLGFFAFQAKAQTIEDFAIRDYLTNEILRLQQQISALIVQPRVAGVTTVTTMTVSQIPGTYVFKAGEEKTIGSIAIKATGNNVTLKKISAVIRGQLADNYAKLSLVDKAGVVLGSWEYGQPNISGPYPNSIAMSFDLSSINPVVEVGTTRSIDIILKAKDSIGNSTQYFQVIGQAIEGTDTNGQTVKATASINLPFISQASSILDGQINQLLSQARAVYAELSTCRTQKGLPYMPFPIPTQTANKEEYVNTVLTGLNALQTDLLACKSSEDLNAKIATLQQQIVSVWNQLVALRCATGLTSYVVPSADKTQYVSALTAKISELQGALAKCQTPTICAKEGEKWIYDNSSAPTNPLNKSLNCCAGLLKAGGSVVYDSSCRIIGGIVGGNSGPCTKCGNGVCETGENSCNCPTDCSTVSVCNNNRVCEATRGETINNCNDCTMLQSTVQILGPIEDQELYNFRGAPVQIKWTTTGITANDIVYVRTVRIDNETVNNIKWFDTSMLTGINNQIVTVLSSTQKYYNWYPNNVGKWSISVGICPRNQWISGSCNVGHAVQSRNVYVNLMGCSSILPAYQACKNATPNDIQSQDENIKYTINAKNCPTISCKYIATPAVGKLEILSYPADVDKISQIGNYKATYDVELGKINLKAIDADVKINQLSGIINVYNKSGYSKAPNSVVTRLHLYDSDGLLLANAIPDVYGNFTFNDGPIIPKYVSQTIGMTIIGNVKTLIIRADISAVASQGDYVAWRTTRVAGSSGENIVLASNVVYGKKTHLYSVYPILTLVSTNITKTAGDGYIGSDSGDCYITFKAKAVGGDIKIKDSTVAIPGLNMFSNNPQLTAVFLSAKDGASYYSPEKNYIIYAGQEKTFQIAGHVNPLSSGYYYCYAENFRWDNGQGAISNWTKNNYSPIQDYKTNAVYLIKR